MTTRVFRRSTWGVHTAWFNPDAVARVAQGDPTALKLNRHAVRVRRFPKMTL